MRVWLPWVIIGLSVAGGLVLLVWSFLHSEDEDLAEGGVDALEITAAEGRKPFETTTEEYRSTAQRRMLSLKASLESSLETSMGPRASSNNRMTMPWFMLVGAEGSGKDTVLANCGLPLPYGPPMEVDALRKDAGKWWLFEHAVMLEAPDASGTTAGTSTLPPDQTVADSSVGWQTLLHMLRRERPDSPLNGIVVTVSCADLLSGRLDPQKLTDQAERIRKFLERTRRMLGVRLPLHVLVTKCDSLPGFRSFAEAMPEERRSDIFGWANPNDVEERFDATWIDTGFDALRADLVSLRDELLAAPDEVRDTVGLFVFDTEFVDIQEPLKEFVSKLMTEGERRPSLFFRGMYFTGDANEPVANEHAVTIRADQQPRGGEERNGNGVAGDHSLVFLRSVFEEKVFKEAGLARPTARLRLAADRRVVLAQAATILLLLGGSSGLWGAVYGLRRGDETITTGLRSDALTLTRVLSGLAIDLDEVRRGSRADSGSMDNRRARDAAVIELVAQIRDVPAQTHVRSAFLPTSWFSSLPTDVRQSMMRGVQNIILPVTRERLQERADRLLGATDAPGTDVADPRALVDYLNDVHTLSRNIARYNSLASPTSGNVAELSALLDYLFGERFAADSTLATADFEAALQLAAGPTIPVTPTMANAVIRRAAGRISTVASSAGRQLAPRNPALPARARDADDDLQALKGLAGLMSLADARSGLMANVSDSEILGVKLARILEDSVQAQLRFAAARIRRDTLSPAEAADTLNSVLGEVFQLRLMAPIEGRQIVSDLPADRRLRWDVGRLELASALRAEFLQAVIRMGSALPGQPPERMQRALEGQLRARVVDVAASAQRFTPASEESMLEVRSEAANLEAASPRLIRLSVMLDSLGAGFQGARLLAGGARQAEHTLAMAQAIVDRQQYFAPQTAKIVAWQGVIPLQYAALGVSDSGNAYTTLLNHTVDVRTLAHDVAPALRYLRLAKIDSVHAGSLLKEWEELATSVQRYERGDFTSSLGMLWRFVRENMQVNDLITCQTAVGLEDPRPVADLFMLRQRQFRSAMAARCRGAGPDVLLAYGRLRALFASRLAGRFPFVDSLQMAGAPDVDPAVLREFLRQYAIFAVSGDVALRSDPRLSQTARGAIEFLDQMASVRRFFAPILDAERSPELNIVLGAGDEQHEIRWHYGDSVRVATAVDSLGNQRETYAHGGWAPVRYAMQGRDTTARIRFFHPGTKIELQLPSRIPALAPEIVVPRPR